ncbi:MAG: zinc ribbon domain-containing protein [Dehalococcoidales bacterium]|jgi:uncharacterized protein YcfJ|nr:zinc ribbon domain-containing protein [Dehalococcoidales bacterium]MDX9986254.1 zinc ribbon domain-containing protein [Dehalococcoidales bacterium]NLE90774.1 hypothetical protein [Dehalococcoidales bacterium]
MVARIQKILRYTVFFTLGFAVAGAILGFMLSSQDEREWIWIAGFALIGGFAGAAIALVTGRYKMLFKLVVAGAIVGALSQWMIIASVAEEWLQMTISGAVFGAFAGISIPMLEREKKLPVEKTFECDECGRKVGKDDKFCAGCGTEFE